jgi:hypothetical protein
VMSSVFYELVNYSVPPMLSDVTPLYFTPF